MSGPHCNSQLVCDPVGAEQPPPWPSPPSGERLAVVVSAHVRTTADREALQRCLCSVRTHHPSAWINLVDNGSPSSTGTAPAVGLRPCRFSRRVGVLRVIAAALHGAMSWSATHLAYMEQHMQLLQPLPLRSLACHFVSFQTYTHSSALAHDSQRMVNLLTADVRNESERPMDADAGDAVAQGFVVDRVGLHRLAAHRILDGAFLPCDASDREYDESLRALSVFAALRLDSQLPDCSLDGCAPGGLEHMRGSCMETRFTRGLLPPVGASRAMEDFSACSGGSRRDDTPSRTVSEPAPLNRYVAPPTSIASDVLVRIELNGTASFGAAALALPDEGAAMAGSGGVRLLISLHGGRPKDADEMHIRMLNLPIMQAVPLIRDAALLLFNNDRSQKTAVLVGHLRRYKQRTKWLIHSPYNLGYLCGEWSSLSSCAHVWLRYDWVLHAKTDIVFTPEFLLRLSARLPRAAADVALILDPFKQRPPRYNMEVFVWRPRNVLVGNNATRDAGTPETMFHVGSRLCISRLPKSSSERPRMPFPEDMLYFIPKQHGLKIDSEPLGASNLFMRPDLAHARTHMFPGGTWHAHNATLYSKYLDAIEHDGGNPYLDPHVMVAYVRLMYAALQKEGLHLGLHPPQEDIGSQQGSGR